MLRARALLALGPGLVAAGALSACGSVDAPAAAAGAGGATATTTTTTSASGGAGGATTTSTSSSAGGAGGATTSCAAPEQDCGGACVDPTSDAAHCGACGRACGAGESCCAGSCSTGCALAVASVTPDHGPMSGGTWITIRGDGFAKGVRVTIGGSRAPARVVDATTILALAPPGLAGDADVRVDLAAAHAARAQSFRYLAYGTKGTWRTIDMSSPRGNWPGISVLQDGRVLITGGVANADADSVLASADLYDPVAQTTAKTAGDMSAPRWTQAQVTLLGGEVLVLGTWFGGYSPPNGPIADRFDPTTGTFAPTKGKPFLEHRWPHAALLADGRVLVLGGAGGMIDLYDPETDTFIVSPIQTDLTGYRPARLLDGRVLFARGAKSPSLFFDPETGTLAPAGAGPTALQGDLHTLPDGRVLYVGGRIPTADANLPTDVIEIFDPKVPGFAPAPFHLATARQQTLTTAMLGDGSVLVIGGEIGVQVPSPACNVDTFVITDGVERIDALAGTVTAFDPLPQKSFLLSAATMPDGSIVAAGGAPCGGGAAYPYFYFLEGHR